MSGRFWGVVGIVGMGVVGAIAYAGDDPGCEPGKCPVIEPKTIDEYEKMMAALEVGAFIDDWPGLRDPTTLPQLWEGMSGVIPFDPLDQSWEKETVGNVFTRFVSGQGWVETWVLHDPELRMTQPQRLPHLGGGSYWSHLDDFQALSDVNEYGVLTFKFQYMCPPNTAAFEGLPTVVPWFVTDVLRSRVYFTEDGVEQEAGALYRERMDIPTWMSPPHGINWQDTWVLWDNFDVPNPDPVLAIGREVRLEATPWGGETVRGFLQEQMYNLPGKCVVRTRSDVVPVPLP